MTSSEYPDLPTNPLAMLPFASTPTPPPSPPREPTVLTCRTTADLLAALPRLTGFTAEDSLFLVLFHGIRARCAMRVDLPRSSHPHSWEPLIDLIGDVALRARFTDPDAQVSPAVVITTRLRFGEEIAIPWGELATQILRRLRRDGVPPREACCQAADGWGSYLDESGQVPRRPLSEIAESPVSGASSGLAHPPSLAELGTIPQPTQEHAAAVRAALSSDAEHSSTIDPFPLRALGHSFDPGIHWDQQSGLNRSRQVLRWIVETTTVAHNLTARSEAPALSPRATARLGLRANSTDGWFLIALALLTRPRFPAELAIKIGPQSVLGVPLDLPAVALPCSASLGPPYSSVRDFLELASRAVQDHALLARARSRLLTSTGALPPELRAGPIALIAMLWWLGGVQSVSGRLLEQARQLRPEDPIIELLARVTEIPAFPPSLSGFERKSA